MILLWGSRADPPLAAVASSLSRMGAAHVVADGRARCTRPWSPRAECALEIDGRAIDLAEVDAAFVRPPDLSPDPEARLVAESLLAWTDTTDAFVVNRPAKMSPNNSKPLQTRAIAREGFLVPETLVTTDPASVCDFAARHGEIVYKSVSGHRSIVRRLSPRRLAALDDVATCPTQFQKYIPGDDVRVHVFGDACHALLVRGEGDDYRYPEPGKGAASAKELPLPPDFAARIAAMTARMGLVVAGVDFRRTRDRVWYCLEVNPSPAFTYYERLAGARLADRVAALLVRGAKPAN